jgi:hypothetical protein
MRCTCADREAPLCAGACDEVSGGKADVICHTKAKSSPSMPCSVLRRTQRQVQRSCTPKRPAVLLCCKHEYEYSTLLLPHPRWPMPRPMQSRGWGIVQFILVPQSQHRHRLALSKPLRADHRVHLLQVGPGRAAELVAFKLALHLFARKSITLPAVCARSC